MDNGQVKVFTGYRVQHNVSRGPGKGGIRFHPNVTLDEVKGAGGVDDLEDRHRERSVWRSQGGVICDPKRMSKNELERMTRRYASEILPIIDPPRTFRAGCLHRCADHGLDHGHLCHDRGPFRAWSRHRQAVSDRRSEGRLEATARGLLLRRRGSAS